MNVDPIAEQVRGAIRREDETLQRVVGFIHEGMRNGRISDASGEALVGAAEAQHAAAVRPLQRRLSDRLRQLLGELEGGQE